MRIHNWFLMPLLAIGISAASAPQVHAEPLTPLSSAELQYLEQLHRVLAVSSNPVAYRGDGELLNLGRRVCHLRDQGIVGQGATLVTPAITQLAFIYLCPQ
jgi:hypothetical protein